MCIYSYDYHVADTLQLNLNLTFARMCLSDLQGAISLQRFIYPMPWKLSTALCMACASEQDYPRDNLWSGDYLWQL